MQLYSSYFTWRQQNKLFEEAKNKGQTNMGIHFVYNKCSMKPTVASLAFFLDEFFEHMRIVVSLGTSTQHLVILLVIVYISKQKVYNISGSG